MGELPDSTRGPAIGAEGLAKRSGVLSTSMSKFRNEIPSPVGVLLGHELLVAGYKAVF
ncbi:UNVERIFIED_CONTAM: hypothetical protein Slati_3811600 [Sesamum latifolium]|uniref:Uncharacterized protein n=1 Tax=Sesamum latifolium TaxID=2727402 RepID=A0AAW2U5U4_9LAMI